MEVKWCDETNEKQRWSSDEDNFCTPYEAEKVLPSCVTNITVQFKVVLSDGHKRDVCKVDRSVGGAKENARLLASSNGKAFKESAPEVVELRTNPAKIIDNDRGTSNSIDAIFTLAGSSNDCYLKSAWNAAGEPRSWEVNDYESERPEPSLPLPVLIAADETPTPPSELMNSASGVVYATNRFVAALRALQEVRRVGMEQLAQIDKNFDLQWWLINIGNTASLISDTTSALTVVSDPVTSIVTGFMGATITSSCWIYDTIGEEAFNKKARTLLFWMLRNCVAVQELEKKWLRATKRAEDEQVLSQAIEYGILGSHYETLKTITGNTFCVVMDVTSSTLSIPPPAVVPLKYPLYLTWIGVVGCALVCLNGWVNTKQSQKTIQEMAVQLKQCSDKTDEALKAMMSKD